MKITTLTLAAAVLSACLSLNAAEVNDSATIDEVVVTGTRIGTDVRYLPLTVTTVGRPQIESRYEMSLLPLLNEQVPGLFVTSRGVYGYGVSTGSAGGMKIRGIGGSPTTEMMVLVDGHPQYAGLMGHTVADVYQSMLAEKVEVVRGPASVLYGSNAMGGVMNIVTRDMTADGWKNKVRLAAGSYGTLTGEYTSMLRQGRLKNIFALSGAHSDGHRSRMTFNQYAVYDKMTYALNHSWQLTGDVNINHFNAQNPGTVSVPMMDNIMHITRGMASVGLANDYRNASGSLTYYIDWGHHKIDDGYRQGATPKTYLFHLRDHTYGINWYETFRLFEGNNTTVGFDYQHVDGSAWNAAKTDGTRTYSADDRKTDEVAGYVDFRQTIMGALTFDGGLRYSHHSLAGSQWIPQAGISINVARASVLKATVSKGYRNPTLKELYMFNSKNPELQPERMMNYELSWQQLISQRLKYGVNVFYADADNLIETEKVGSGMMNMNTGKMHNWGAEATAAYTVSAALSLNANYSYLHTNKPMTAAPRHKLYVGADYHIGRMALSSGLQWVGHLLTVASPETTEDFVLCNLRASYRAAKWLDIFVKGENLLAQKYEINAGFPMPRATFMGGVDINL